MRIGTWKKTMKNLVKEIYSQSLYLKPGLLNTKRERQPLDGNAWSGYSVSLNSTLDHPVDDSEVTIDVLTNDFTLY